MSYAIPSAPSSSGDLPVLIYDSVFTDADATVTTDSEEATYPHALAPDWDPGTAWLPAADGSHHIQAQFAAARAADCVFIYAPDLAVNGGTFQVQHSSDGAAWTSVTAATSLTADKPIGFLSFASVSDLYWRVVIDSTPASFVPIVAVGEKLTLQRGLPVDGYSLPSLSLDVDIDNMESGDGTFVARTVRVDGCRQRIDARHIDVDWFVANLRPFLRHAFLKPFGFAPLPTNHPDELALLWARNIPDQRFDGVGIVSLSIDGRGICNHGTLD